MVPWSLAPHWVEGGYHHLLDTKEKKEKSFEVVVVKKYINWTVREKERAMYDTQVLVHTRYMCVRVHVWNVKSVELGLFLPEKVIKTIGFNARFPYVQ